MTDLNLDDILNDALSKLKYANRSNLSTRDANTVSSAIMVEIDNKVSSLISEIIGKDDDPPSTNPYNLFPKKISNNELRKRQRSKARKMGVKIIP